MHTKAFDTNEHALIHTSSLHTHVVGLLSLKHLSHMSSWGLAEPHQSHFGFETSLAFLPLLVDTTNVGEVLLFNEAAVNCRVYCFYKRNVISVGGNGDSGRSYIGGGVICFRSVGSICTTMSAAITKAGGRWVRWGATTVVVVVVVMVMMMVMVVVMVANGRGRCRGDRVFRVGIGDREWRGPGGRGDRSWETGCKSLDRNGLLLWTAGTTHWRMADTMRLC